jgi:hypothetical protein
MRLAPRVFAILASAIAVAATPLARSGDVTALYQVYWAGLPAAQIRLTLHEEASAYRSEIAIGSQGLSRLVTRFRGTAVATGRLSGNQPPQPSNFDASYDLRKRKDRRLAMPFTVRDGAVVAERGLGDTSRKPPLAEKFRRNVLDPLSAVSAIREALRRGEAAFTIPVYDGARRFDIEARVVAREEGATPRLRLALTLHAIAGFKGESSDDGDPDDAPRPLSLTLSGDGRLVPLEMSVPMFFLPLTAELVKLCDAAANCTW